MNVVSKNQRVLVTGANGFLGRHVVTHLSNYQPDLLTPRRTELDLLCAKSTQRYLMEHEPEIVVHLAAACGGISENVAKPAAFLRDNTLMGLNLLEASRLAGTRRFVLISTTCAYPQDAPIPLREDSLWSGKPTSATGPYGLAKRFLHEAVEQYENQYGLDGRILIPANLYGPGDHYGSRSHVVAALIERYVDATKRKVPTVTNWGDGSATREFMYVSDAASAIALATFAESFTGPMNLGTGVETSIKDLAEMISQITNFGGETLWDTTKPTGQPRRSLNIERLKTLGFAPSCDLMQGLKNTIGDYKKP